MPREGVHPPHGCCEGGVPPGAARSRTPPRSLGCRRVRTAVASEAEAGQSPPPRGLAFDNAPEPPCGDSPRRLGTGTTGLSTLYVWGGSEGICLAEWGPLAPTGPLRCAGRSWTGRTLRDALARAPSGVSGRALHGLHRLLRSEAQGRRPAPRDPGPVTQPSWTRLVSLPRGSRGKWVAEGCGGRREAPLAGGFAHWLFPDWGELSPAPPPPSSSRLFSETCPVPCDMPHAALSLSLKALTWLMGHLCIRCID